MTNLKFGKCTRAQLHVGPQHILARSPASFNSACIADLISMGCGGSRADAIEPRYHESWTRETESTWLTNTDAEIPNGVIYKNRAVRGECGRGTETRSCGDRGRRMVNAGTQCGKQVSSIPSTCTNYQRTSCGHEQISDSTLTTSKEGTALSEGVSSNAVSHPGQPMKKNSSSPHAEDTL